VTWEKLPAGLYEAHFEAAGFKKFVKRVVLAEDGPGLVLKVQLDLNTPQTLGGGPSGQQLAQDLAALKKEQAELQKQIADLRAEVAKLKK
jgi:cell division protein FtsB